MIYFLKTNIKNFYGKTKSKPDNPNFSSGPCSKRPGWTIDALKNTPIGRSHRHKVCKEKLNEVIVKSKKILQLPEDYHVGVMTGSNTGALEAALWSLLGLKVLMFWLGKILEKIGL